MDHGAVEKTQTKHTDFSQPKGETGPLVPSVGATSGQQMAPNADVKPSMTFHPDISEILLTENGGLFVLHKAPSGPGYSISLPT